ncbi:Aspartyl/glutamyl-tRNA(Asn/Gln) amidotransferase subunit [Dirofilaria immitis]
MPSRFGFHTNHFGISDEELEYDENDPSWFITSPNSNVLHGKYESAKPFIEKIQSQQRAFLEEKLEERRELRQSIRERVSRNFDEKLRQHMAKFQPRPREPLILELFLSQQKDELEESFRKRLGKSYVPKSKSAVSPDVISKSAATQPTFIISKSQLSVEESASVSFARNSYQPLSATTNISASNIFSASPLVTVAILNSTMSSIFDRDSTSKVITSTSPSSSYITPEVQQQSVIFSTSALPPQKNNTLTFVSTSETSKGGHAMLTRTDSVSSCKSSASRSTSWPLQQIVEEDQCTTTAAKGNESMTRFVSTEESNNSAIVKNGISDDANIKNASQYHQIYENELNFARTFMANMANIPDSVKNELKCTIKEKISVSTKKFAKPSDIAQIVRFFNNLLNGMTISGFNDKVINLKNDKQAHNWVMVHIIDTYLDLVPQDISLLKVVTSVLSSLALSSITFSKLLFGKLFIASPLLSVSHDECLRCILDLKKRSERFAETMVAWRSREIAIINLFIALKMSSANADLQTAPENNGLGLMWKMIALIISENSAFGAILITEILKQHWNVMHTLYGKQMEKLVILIDRSILPFWRGSLRKIVPGDSEMNETVQNVADNCLTSLKFTIDNCLSSFRS